MKNKTAKKKIKWEDRMPTIDLRGKNYLPEISDCQIGDVVELTIKAKLTRKEEGGYDYELGCGCGDCEEDCEEQNSKKQSATFKAQSIKMKASKSDSFDKKFNSLMKKGLTPSEALKRAKG